MGIREKIRGCLLVIILNKLQKECESNQNPVIPTYKIYDVFFDTSQDNRKLSKKSQNQLTERLLKHKEKVREKKKIIKLDQELKDLNQTKPEYPMHEPLKGDKKIAKSPSESVQSYNMYEHQMEMEFKRKLKMYELAEELHAKEVKYSPPKYVRKNHRTIHKRLYEDSKKRKENLKEIQAIEASKSPKLTENDSSAKFVPSINKVSKKIIRDGKICDRLMDDAKKRRKNKKIKQKLQYKEIKTKANPKSHSKSSKYIFKKFCKEYSDVLYKIKKAKGDMVTIQELGTVMVELGFLTEQVDIEKLNSIITDVWIIIGGESKEELSESSVFNIVCIILNFDFPFLYFPERKELNEEEFDENTVGIIGKDGIFYLRHEREHQRLHSHFYDLAFNRMNKMNGK
jgi:hypothetical protein